MKTLLIESLSFKEFFPVSETRLLWQITCGAKSSWERAEIFSRGEVSCFCDFDRRPPFSEKKYSGETVELALNAQFILPLEMEFEDETLYLSEEDDWLLLCSKKIGQSEILALFENTIDGLKDQFHVKVLPGALFLKDVASMVKKNAMALKADIEVLKLGKSFREYRKNVFVSTTSEISENVAFHTEQGPVLIDEGVVIRDFSIIDGPCYIGKNSVIDSAKIREGVSIRSVCKIGGEVEESIIESYSNKHHEGFLGHSYLGSWVNIGAIATTSDLKNNYGEVRLKVGEKELPTGTNKFGSIICDYSKIGIGMMLNTGTVISFGVNLFLEYRTLPKYIPAFSWGLNQNYDRPRFLRDLEVVMKRRGVTLSDEMRVYLQNL